MEVDSISAAASALGCSKRTAFRHLKQGRIVKTQNGSFEVSDIAATDSGPDIADNGTVPYKKPFSDSKTPVKNNAVDSLKSELAASRLSLEIEKANAARSEWQNRRDSLKMAEARKEAFIKAEKIKVAAGMKAKIKADAMRKTKMAQLKAAVLPETWRDVLPSGVQAQIVMEIFKLAGDSEFLSYEDLLCIATASRDKILSKNYDSVAQAFSDYGRSLMVARAKQLYQELLTVS